MENDLYFKKKADNRGKKVDIYSRYMKLSDKTNKLLFEKGLTDNELILKNNNSNFRMKYYKIFENMFISFFEISAFELTGNSDYSDENYIHFNYCVEGRIELALEDGFNVCLTAGDFCLSRERSHNPSFFPTKNYQGISIYFDTALFPTNNYALLQAFNLKFESLGERYFIKRNTSVAKSDDTLKSVMLDLWTEKETVSEFKLKHSAIFILNILISHSYPEDNQRTYYTQLQAEIAKRAEKILTVNLQEHVPIKIVAEKFMISETSLKNYFKAVFGENISEYLRKIRMKKAAKMLRETKLSIGDISHSVGYTKQGKFAEIFRRYYDLSPLEYRRYCNLGKKIN